MPKDERNTSDEYADIPTRPSATSCRQIKHEDFMEGINVVSAKKKGSLDYYA